MHDNVGQLLVEIIRGSRDFMLSATASERCHNSLLVTAESKEICEVSFSIVCLKYAFLHEICIFGVKYFSFLGLKLF